MVGEDRSSVDELTKIANLARIMSRSDMETALESLPVNPDGKCATPELYLQAYDVIAFARARLESIEPGLRERLEKAMAENLQGIPLAQLENAVISNWQFTLEACSLQARVKAECVLATYVREVGKLEGNGRELLEDVVACSVEAYQLLKRIDAWPSAGNWLVDMQDFLYQLFNVWAYSACLMHIDAFSRAKSASLIAELQGDIAGKVSETEMLRILDYARDAYRWGLETVTVLDTASEHGIKVAKDEFRADLVARNEYLLNEVLELDEQTRTG